MIDAAMTDAIDGERRTLAPARDAAGAPLRVRKPSGALLDPAGEAVAIDSYWRRRLADADVLEVSPEAPDADEPQPEPQSESGPPTGAEA